MAKGISVHVGVNKVNAPGINLADLKGCVNDAVAMHGIASARGFISDGPILDEEATFNRVENAIRAAAGELEDGDIFLFTFAGHGTRRGTEDIEETDSKDETIVLHDRILIDNYLRRNLWPLFADGVRVLMVSDSCHSGTVAFKIAKDGGDSQTAAGDVTESVSVFAASNRSTIKGVRPVVYEGETAEEEVVTMGGRRVRAIPDAAQRRHFNLLSDFYSKLRKSIPSGAPPPLKASILLLAACKDRQEAADGDLHGAFTKALLEAWAEGNFPGNYEDFRTAIAVRIPANLTQEPQLTPAIKPPGPALTAFMAQRPFTR